MSITQEDLKDFIAIYKKELGTDISEKQALDLAIPLLTLTKSILLPNLEKEGEK